MGGSDTQAARPRSREKQEPRSRSRVSDAGRPPERVPAALYLQTSGPQSSAPCRPPPHPRLFPQPLLGPVHSAPRLPALHAQAGGRPPGTHLAGTGGPVPAAPTPRRPGCNNDILVISPAIVSKRAQNGNSRCRGRLGYSILRRVAPRLATTPKKPPRSAPTWRARGHPPGRLRQPPGGCGRCAPAEVTPPVPRPRAPRAPRAQPRLPAPFAGSQGRSASLPAPGWGRGRSLLPAAPIHWWCPARAPRAAPRRPELTPGSPSLRGQKENVTLPRRPALRPFPHPRQTGVRGSGAQAAPGSLPRDPRAPPTQPPSRAPEVHPARQPAPLSPQPRRLSRPEPRPCALRPLRLAPSSTQTSLGAPVQQVQDDMACPPISQSARGSSQLPPLRPARARRTVGPHGRRLRTGRPGRHRRTGGRPARGGIWRGAGPAPGGAPGLRAATPAGACRLASWRSWRARPGEHTPTVARGAAGHAGTAEGRSRPSSPRGQRPHAAHRAGAHSSGKSARASDTHPQQLAQSDPLGSWKE